MNTCSAITQVYLLLFYNMLDKLPEKLWLHALKFSKVLSFFALCAILSCESPFNMGSVLTLETIDSEEAINFNENAWTTSWYDKEWTHKTWDTLIISNVQYKVVDVRAILPVAPPM